MNRLPSNTSISSSNSSTGSRSAGCALYDFPSSSSVMSETGSTDYRSDESFSDYVSVQIKGRVDASP